MKNGLIILDDGDKRWYLNDKLHRKDGPAAECTDGRKYWYLNGKLHREDGPAIEHTDGYKAWYYHGKYLKVSSLKEFRRLVDLSIFW